MLEGIVLVENVTRFNLEFFLTLFFSIGLLIVMALRFHIGAMLGFFINGLLALWFWTADWEWRIPLIVSLLFLVAMAIALFISKSGGGGLQ